MLHTVARADCPDVPRPEEGDGTRFAAYRGLLALPARSFVLAPEYRHRSEHRHRSVVRAGDRHDAIRCEERIDVVLRRERERRDLLDPAVLGAPEELHAAVDRMP